VLAAGAARYESGSWSRPNLAGLLAAIDYHAARETAGPHGAPDVAAYCADRVRTVLGATVHTPPGQLAGLVSFSLPDAEPRALAGELERAGVVIRSIPGTDYLRVSCAFFTTTADIDTLVATIAALTGRKAPH
jgi:selenocysteine lyase/cysteine desulfurase